MVIVKLQGGLGNQMFQYAAARNLIKNSEKVYLDYQYLNENNTDTEHFTARPFELGIFKNLKIEKVAGWRKKLLLSRRRPLRLLRALWKKQLQYIRQQENELVTFTPQQKNASLYLDGYFQSEKYFERLRKQLLHEFEFPEFDNFNESIKQEILKAPNAVSIHIRRGDYLKSEKILNVHGVMPYAYYQNALDTLALKFQDLELFIFSEDLEWVKTNFKQYNAHFLDHNRAVDSWKDMALMACCKHHVIANSSFSWWGAWLSQNDNGCVFAPASWFNPKTVNFNIADFIPERWSLLSFE